MIDRKVIFYYNLMEVLMPSCPVRTGNMFRHIKMTETPDSITISITAPTMQGGKPYDYAEAVNEALAAQAANRALSEKERINYHWINRSIAQAAELTGDKVVYQGGFTI